MFEIQFGEEGRIQLIGRFDAAQEEIARRSLDTIQESCVLDFSELEYISSAGLGLLLMVQQRLNAAGHSLTLVHLNDHLKDVFRYAGFNSVFRIE